jgi:hypothetical protein
MKHYVKSYQPNKQFVREQPLQRNLSIVVAVILLNLISNEPLNSKENKRILYSVVGLPVKRFSQIQIIRT